MVERLPPTDGKKSVRKSNNNDFASSLIGCRIQALRLSGDIDIRDVAKRLNMGKKQLIAVEQGAEVADVRILHRLCDLFSVDANYFFQDFDSISGLKDVSKIKSAQAKDLKRLFEAYLSIPNRALQKSLVELAESISKPGKK